MLWMLLLLLSGEVYNIGTEKERTVLEVAHEIAKYFGMGPERVIHVKDRWVAGRGTWARATARPS
jgi:nucleoside-diphosphate-sugar epimerase